jgi:uncharacterized protein (UPF0332 family)
MTPDQAALVRKAQASIASARLLLENGYPDFAISRAYYAMFYVAEALLLMLGLSFSKHGGVIAAFGQHLAKTGRVPVAFHRYLIEGQASRHAGDYDLSARLTPADAAEQIDRAGQFLKLAEELLGPLPTES